MDTYKKEVKKMFRDINKQIARVEILKARYKDLDEYTGVTSVKYDLQITNGDRIGINDIIERKDKLLIEINKLDNKIYLFKLAFDTLDQNERNIMWEVYANNYDVKTVCRKYNYSRSRIYEIIDVACKKMHDLIKERN